jgi:hypothetical protein
MTTVPRTTLTLKRSARQPSAKPAPVPAPSVSRFYFVWARDGQRPKKRHARAEEAHAEAARLHGVAPERQFLVYEARRLEGAP